MDDLTKARIGMAVIRKANTLDDEYTVICRLNELDYWGWIWVSNSFTPVNPDNWQPAAFSRNPEQSYFLDFA